MRKQIILYVLMIVVALGGIIFWAMKSDGVIGNDGKLVLFYREDCPHCKNVDAFIEKNKIKVNEKMANLQHLEVSSSQANIDQLVGYAKKCGALSAGGNISVPFMWNGSSCLVGDVDIINYIEQKIK